jgi:hypothetical protein
MFDIVLKKSKKVFEAVQICQEEFLNALPDTVLRYAKKDKYLLLLKLSDKIHKLGDAWADLFLLYKAIQFEDKEDYEAASNLVDALIEDIK